MCLRKFFRDFVTSAIMDLLSTFPLSKFLPLSTFPLPLSTFHLPLSTNGPPAGYDWEEREMSLSSTTSAFATGIDQRDTFLGEPRCIICGMLALPATFVGPIVKQCLIIRDSEPEVVSRNSI